MGDLLDSYFRADYMPHGHCYFWQPHILWAHVISDLVIAAAYFSIPIALIAFIRNRPDIEHRAVFVLFSGFILMCGISHLMGVWTIWQGVYGLHGIAKILTAIISLVTAISLYRLMPQIVKIPTLEQYEGIINKWSDSQKENEYLSGQLRSQKLTQFVLDSIPISLLLVDDEGRVILSNSFYNKEFNDNEELNSVHISTLFQGNSTEFKWEFHQEKLFDGVEIGDQIKFLDSVQYGNKLIPVEVVITKKEFQEKMAFVITIKDLREVMQIKQMLIDSNSRFERAVRATEEGLWEWDLKANKMIWSPKFYSMIGAKLGDEPSFDSWLSNVHPDYVDAVSHALNQHLEHGERFYVEYVGKNETGEYGWFAINGNSILDINDVPTLVSGSLRYIEEEKQKEEKYYQKNKLLNAIYEGSSNAIFVVNQMEDDELCYTILNDTALKIVNVPKDVIIGKPFKQLAGSLLPQAFVDHVSARYRSCINSKKTIEYIEKVETIRTFWFQTTLYPIADSRGDVSMLVGTATDITELKIVEEKLEKNTEFLESLVNNSVCGMYIFDLTTYKNTLINEAYQTILGYTIDDLDKCDNLLALFHPDEQELITTHLDKMANCKEGELHPLEYRFKHKNGDWVWCYSVDSILTRHPDGTPSQVLGTFVDVTEKNQLVDKLKESNEYLERFAFVASHDLQEPLRKITAFSDSLSERLTPLIENDDASIYELSRMKLAAQRMGAMIHDLLKLSRITSNSLDKKNISLPRLLEEVCDILELSIADRKADVNWDKSVGDIVGDEGLILQMMQNIISNSLKFCNAETTPCVSIRCKYRAQNVDIIIQDNGIGIQDSEIANVFEPFRRLHVRDEYEGSGIGLAIVTQIVSVHKGTIACDSEVGVGTTITISLPRH
ncbi:PAS domain S-box protein [Psychrosphaera sp. 1_MG-2023]|uniref:PAS domain S-box protein n=1 Tax=Psychrosphaera sp. 1_MG-2023 TaxID=3062643 RepID=UPI0026E1BBFD|nr:PAS domain S-box protein [Psychrosphaera sp. 1_MG-2023]MDO6720727.1 PAS domain S-box protein [Psychrosphaera sp. 1_MG-2023]